MKSMNEFLNLLHSQPLICIFWTENWVKRSPEIAGAISDTYSTWRMSRVRVGHACASFVKTPCHAYASVTCSCRSSSALITRAHQVCVRVAMKCSKSRARVGHACASCLAGQLHRFFVFFPFSFFLFWRKK